MSTGNKHSKTRYETIVPREFKATIPDHILDRLPTDERYIVSALSKLENSSDWVVQHLLKTNKAIQDLDSRIDDVNTRITDGENEQAALNVRVQKTEGVAEKVQRLWDWKQYFSGKWAALGCIGLVVLTALVKVACDALYKHFTH
jgi:hypothetical protein